MTRIPFNQLKVKVLVLLLSAILTLLFTGQTSNSQENSGNFEIYVVVKSEKDPSIVEFIKALIKAEFINIPDVTLTQEIGVSTTHILDLSVISRTGDLTIASVFCENVKPYLLLSPYISPKHLEILSSDRVFPEYYHHRVATFLENYLDAPDACRDIVEKIDVLVLDVLREKEAGEIQAK